VSAASIYLQELQLENFLHLQQN